MQWSLLMSLFWGNSCRGFQLSIYVNQVLPMGEVYLLMSEELFNFNPL